MELLPRPEGRCYSEDLRQLCGPLRLRLDFEAEADEVALLPGVVDEEADADGERNQRGRCTGQDLAVAKDDLQHDEEDDQAQTDGRQDDPGSPSIRETAHRVFHPAFFASL